MLRILGDYDLTANTCQDSKIPASVGASFTIHYDKRRLLVLSSYLLYVMGSFVNMFCSFVNVFGFLRRFLNLSVSRFDIGMPLAQ